jgi:hypothetical protein
MSIPEGEATYSVSLRLRRVTFEYAYVSVPVVDDVVKPDEQGVNRIDFGELTRIAIEMSQSPEVTWYREEQNTVPHPLQKAPDAGEKRFAV